MFGGLILLLLGTLILYHNFYGGFDFWRLFVTWWPALLIIWGLAKLVDYFIAQQTGQAAPRTITGGDIVLVVLIVLLAGSVATWDRFRRTPEFGELDWPFGGETYSFAEEVPSKPVPATAPITIRTARGNITVMPDTTAEIRATARKTVRESSESSAQTAAQKVTIAINSTGDGLEISPQNQDYRNGQIVVDLEVHVPKGAPVNAHTERGNVQVNEGAGNVRIEGGGDVELHNVTGDVTVDSNRGDRRIEKVKGNVRLSGRGGQVEVSDVQGDVVVEGEYSGPLRFERITKGLRFHSSRSDLTITQATGRVEINSGRHEMSDIPGAVSLTTRRNDLTLDNVTGRLHIENHQGGIEVRFSQPPREPIDLSTDSADIELVVPAKSAFELDASARNGDISTDFDELSKHITESDQKSDRGSRLNATLGSRGPHPQVALVGAVPARQGDTLSRQQLPEL